MKDENRYSTKSPDQVLVANAEVVGCRYGFQIQYGSEQQCAQWLRDNLVSLALLTPLGYGIGAQSVDYRIVAGPVLELDDCTHWATIYLDPTMRAPTTVRFASAHSQDFIIQLGVSVFREKYEQAVELVSVDTTDVAALLRSYDGVVEWDFIPNLGPSLDVSEEWRDLTGAPLPLAFWVCRPEDMKANLLAMLQQMQQEGTEKQQLVSCQGTYRQGVIRTQWGEYTEEALALVLEFLFYHQYLSTIPAVKIWERDPFE